MGILAGTLIRGEGELTEHVALAVLAATFLGNVVGNTKEDGNAVFHGVSGSLEAANDDKASSHV